MFIRSSFRSLFLLQSAWSRVSGQSSQNYTSEAEAALTTLQTWYNSTSGIWDTTGWWNSANCLTVLGDLAAVDPKVEAQASGVFANTLVQAQKYNLQMTKVITQDFDVSSLYGPIFPDAIVVPPVINPKGFLNGYYDDEGWWALGWIQAYDVTKNTQYLQTAADIFEDMKNGTTTPCGGIWWDKAHTYVNAIANELYLSVGAHLANRMTNRQYYLDTALEQWNWFQHSGMINDRSLINDGLSTNCTNNHGTVWTYNQGVILGALAELNAASPNQNYITSAQKIGTAAIKALTDSNGVLHDSCEPKCGADGSQFKGIFSRNLRKLQQVAPQNSFLSFFAANAVSIWRYDRNAANQLSVVWSGPFISPANASTQSSAMDALVAAAAFQRDLGNVIAS